MNRRSSIGIDRRIDLEWLDAAAAQAASGLGPIELRCYLQKILNDVPSSETVNSAQRKTLTVLSHIWSEVPSTATGLRDRAAAALSDATPDQRLALHWAMLLGTYPFFTDVASAAGRLLLLQGDFSLAQLNRRLVEAWGERSTMIRAAQRLIRSMIQWGVLRDTDTRGIYERAPASRPVVPPFATLLAEALLIDNDQSGMAVQQLVGHPALFPFEVQLGVHHLRGVPHFQVYRQGLDVDFVELRTWGCLP